MKHLKQILTLLTGGLMVLTTSAADRPLHVLYLGPVSAGGSFGGPRTNYVYLPGQTLAPEAIYFDHQAVVISLTDAYLKHFDAVVQVVPDSEIGVAQKEMLTRFTGAGNGLIKYTDGNRPEDADLRKAVLDHVGKNARNLL